VHLSHHADFHRLPDWRYRRGEYLVERDERPSPRDDDATIAGWHYLSAMRRCREEEQREEVARGHPALHAAHTLRARPDDLRRCGTEGYLLAGVAPNEIDTRFDLLPGTARCYTEQFFDVLGCLNAPDYLVNVVIGLNTRELHEQDAETFIRLHGLHGGRHVVDALIDYYSYPLGLPLVLTTVTVEDLHLLRQRLQVRATILADCIPDGTTQLRKLLELLLLIERRDREQPQEWPGLRVAIMAMLPPHIPVASPATEKAPSSQLVPAGAT
jgi:hypothetical protein